MTTRILDRFPIDTINAEAREVHFTRTALLFIAAILYGVAWCVAKVFRVLWLALAWTVTAFRVGFRDGMTRKGGGD